VQSIVPYKANGFAKENPIMNGLEFFLTLRKMVGVLLVLPVMLIFIGFRIHEELATQAAYHLKFGDDWKHYYEERFGQNSLSQANTKIVIAILGIPVILTILWIISREIAGKNRLLHHSSRRHRVKR
jgi:hypothetical protein